MVAQTSGEESFLFKHNTKSIGLEFIVGPKNLKILCLNLQYILFYKPPRHIMFNIHLEFNTCRFERWKSSIVYHRCARWLNRWNCRMGGRFNSKISSLTSWTTTISQPPGMIQEYVRTILFLVISQMQFVAILVVLLFFFTQF